jgi:hypothetical protein
MRKPVDQSSIMKRKRRSSFRALVAAALVFSFSTPSEAYVVFDPTNFTANMGNYVSSIKSWTSDLGNQLKGLQQGAQQIQQLEQQIQQYATMISYVGNPQALANAVGLGPVMQLGTQAQSLYGQFSNVHDLQSATSAAGALSNTMNGLYPAINPNNITNSAAFQKYQLLSNTSQQFQKMLDWNNQQQQTLSGAMNTAVSALQSAPNQSAQLRAMGTITAIQSAQQQAHAAAQDAVNTAIVTQIEEQAMNEQADDAAYQEAAKDYVEAEASRQTAAIQSLQRFGTNRPTFTAPSGNNNTPGGATYAPIGVQ